MTKGGYQLETILPPLTGTGKFGGTQSRIIMGGVNVQNTGTNHIPSMEFVIDGGKVQYGLQVSDVGEAVITRIGPNTEVYEVENMYSFLSDANQPEHDIIITGVTPDLHWDEETGILSGVEWADYIPGMGYRIVDIIKKESYTLYIYEDVPAGRNIREVYELAKTVHFISSEYEQGKAGIIAKMQAAGIPIADNASLVQVNDRMAQYTTLLVNGVEFIDGAPIHTLGDAMCSMFYSTWQNYVLRLKSDVPMFNRDYAAQGTVQFQNLIELILPNCTSMEEQENIADSSIIRLYAPKFNTTNAYGIWRNTPTPKLRHLHIPLITLTLWASNHTGNTCVLCYDFSLPTKTVSVDLRLWKPTTAYSTSSQSICDHDEWDDENEPTEGFENNRAKFLWYFEHHFIPSFGDVTTSPTLTLYSGVYDVIAAAPSMDTPEKTLLELLTDKGWNVASV